MNQKAFFAVRVLFFILIGMAASLARAELTIEVTKGSKDATPIAIVPFEWQGSAARPADDIAAIVSADMYRSGMFNPMAPANMISLPTTAQQVFYDEWKKLGIEYLVIGRWKQEGEKSFSASFEIFDVFQGRSLKAETVTATNARWLAHVTADRIFEDLTGIKGAFATRLLYVTMERLQYRKQRYRLYVADSDGFNEKQILESSEPILSPSWAPNGRHIAYVAFRNSHPGIYVQDTVTGKSNRLTAFSGLNGAPRFSPDGQQLAVTLSKDGSPSIYTIDLRTQAAPVRVTYSSNSNVIDTEASWAPDGNAVIFTSDRGGRPQIYRQSLATGGVERLTFDGNYNARASITPDGRFLAMVHQDRGGFQVAVQDLQRGTFNILTDTALDESPSIAPNGIMVIYATTDRDRGVLGVVSIDGRVQVRLPSSVGDVREPAWSPFLY